MNYEFNGELVSALQRAGWDSRRRVKTSSYVADWKREGYTIFPAALVFAENFGGFLLKHPGYNGEGSDESCFDPSAASRRLDRVWVVEDYQVLAGEELIPVGQGYSGHLTYLLGNDGGFYGGFDDYFCRIGRDVEDALANIVFAKGFEKISS
jgi:hypothetical protein